VTGLAWLDGALAQAPLVALVYALLNARLRHVESTLARIERACSSSSFDNRQR
jgi:hypothetical protein